ncbi:hypothetical protein HCN44_007637 [Aphidius gifuensis]|uniref:G-protein coupled receptors family 1 profile domain-containing protein n=1 Tax=Aphidius gifuensis TaxID=684658 RepID=A0A835CNH6_APHGI|nr:neuropeptides capa receptor-like [Aphidius gifuensis]KAF7988143.1 hypothetical protein HCN44_007637 [Aphidius gifuensis]
MDITSSEEVEFENFWDSLKNENLTEADYLTRILGPKQLPLRIIIPLTLAYVTIFLSGVIGNIITCTVIIKNSIMHTATNYYLFSLAISDLILLILGLPNELSCVWQQYPWELGVALCKIRAYVSEMSSYVSVLTIVAFSMERYLAICHPFRAHAMSGLKRPIIIISAAWIIAIISAIPFAIYTNVNYIEYPPDSGNNSADSAICAMLLPDMPNFPLYELSCIVFFLIPMFVMLAVYIRMGLKIRESAKNKLNCDGEYSAHLDSQQVQSRTSIIRMLSAVVFSFFLAWCPFHAQRLLYVYALEADYYPDLNEWLYILGGFLYYFSTTVNPILYNLMSLKYRKAFKDTVLCKKQFRRGTFSNVDDRKIICKCLTDVKSHPKNSRCSVRCKINNDTFKKHESKIIMQNKIDHIDCTNDCDENFNAKLLPNQHLFVNQQSSNESTSANKISESSASSFL